VIGAPGVEVVFLFEGVPQPADEPTESETIEEATASLLTGLLKDEDRYLRRYAAEQLAGMPEQAHVAWQSLVDLVTDQDRGVGQAAAEALAALGPRGNAAKPALLELSRPDQEDLLAGDFAADALLSMELTSQERVSVLIRLLDARQWKLRLKAAKTLSSMGPEAKRALPALVESIEDQDYRIGREALGALGAMGPEAKAALPTVIATARDAQRKFHIRVAATLALGAIGTEEAIPVLADLLLNDGDRQVRGNAATALGTTKTDASGAVPALLETSLDADEWWVVRRWSIRALGRIGPKAKAALPDLINLAEDDHEGVRSVVAVALARIAPQEEAAIATIKRLLTDESKAVREYAAVAVAELEASQNE
jgi:HEAT repeat protein